MSQEVSTPLQEDVESERDATEMRNAVECGRKGGRGAVRTAGSVRVAETTGRVARV